MLELHRISSSQTLQLASRGVLQAALKSSPGFQRAFATAVVKTAASRTGMPPNVRDTFLCWFCGEGRNLCAVIHSRSCCLVCVKNRPGTSLRDARLQDVAPIKRATNKHPHFQPSFLLPNL